MKIKLPADSREVTKNFVSGSYSSNLGFGQLSKSVAFSPSSSSVFIAVLGVILCRTPPKVDQTVIAWISVRKMPSLGSEEWRRSFERRQYQNMKADLSSFAVFVEANSSILVLPPRQFFPHSTGSISNSNTSLTRRRVQFETSPRTSVVSDAVIGKSHECEGSVTNISLRVVGEGRRIIRRYDSLRKRLLRSEHGRRWYFYRARSSIRQTLVSRLFQTPGLILPYASVPTIADTLITGA